MVPCRGQVWMVSCRGQVWIRFSGHAVNTSLYALSSAVPADDIPDKSAWSRFGRLKGARRVYAMEGVHQNLIQTCL